MHSHIQHPGKCTSFLILFHFGTLQNEFYLQFVNKISHCKLLFINNYKGEKNPGPSDDVSEFKYCSATLTNIGYGTL